MERINLMKKNDIIPYTSEDEEKPIMKVNCKFCNSDYREEAEQEYDLKKNILGIYNFLVTKGEKIVYSSVRNHLCFHYNTQKNTEMLREYAQDVNKWLSIQGSREGSLSRRIAILEREMTLLAAKSEELTMDERRKNADTVKKLADTILAYESKLEEYREKVEPYKVFLNYLTTIVNEEIKNIDNKENKEIVLPVLRNILKNIGEKIKESLQ